VKVIYRAHLGGDFCYLEGRKEEIMQKVLICLHNQSAVQMHAAFLEHTGVNPNDIIKTTTIDQAISVLEKYNFRQLGISHVFADWGNESALISSPPNLMARISDFLDTGKAAGMVRPKLIALCNTAKEPSKSVSAICCDQLIYLPAMQKPGAFFTSVSARYSQIMSSVDNVVQLAPGPTRPKGNPSGAGPNASGPVADVIRFKPKNEPS
jgi:hypothetical protein